MVVKEEKARTFGLDVFRRPAGPHWHMQHLVGQVLELCALVLQGVIDDRVNVLLQEKQRFKRLPLRAELPELLSSDQELAPLQDSIVVGPSSFLGFKRREIGFHDRTEAQDLL